MRKKGDCLEKELIQGTTPGSRTRGRPKKWKTDINGDRLRRVLPTLVARTAKGTQAPGSFDKPTLVARTAKGRQAPGSFDK